MNRNKKKEIGDLIKKKSLWGLWGCILLILLVSSCFLTSGTWVIVYHVDQIEAQPDSTFYKASVDLTEEDVWKDHKDDIDDIVDVSFTFKLTNKSAVDTLSGQVYVSSDNTLDTPAKVESLATIILDGISVDPGATLQMTLTHYYDILQNFDTFKDLVKSGKFSAYAITPNPIKMDLSDVWVVVTISGGL